MRIAHVVTYVSEDGAFGGPVRVALAQAAALSVLGHDVTVYAASDSVESQSIEQDGYRLRTFPARRVAAALGFAGMYAPGLTAELRNCANQIDVAHLHLARDLVTLPAASAFRQVGVPFVVQPHGMIDRSRNPLAVPVDLFLTKPALRAAGRVLVLTDRERAEIAALAPRAITDSIANGVPVCDIPPYVDRPEEVLFLARLHPRKRPTAFVEMAELVADGRPNARFIIAGPDEGEGRSVQESIRRSRHSDRIRFVGAIRPAETADMMARAAVYVLPSFGEVFPMSILEAFQAGTPVVATESLGIARDCVRYGAAAVTDGSPTALAAAVTDILSDLSIAERLRAGAQEYLETDLDIEAVASQLVATYETVGKTI